MARDAESSLDKPSSSSNHPTDQMETSSPDPIAQPQSPSSSETLDRAELLSRARIFLNSPHIIHQNNDAKRRFLVEKGLNREEVEGLLNELPLQQPTIPPRAYPQPPRSNLPTLLLGLTRLFAWLTGGSMALAFLYSRLLLPRILRTSTARHSIKSHHLSLLRKLNESLGKLKQEKKELHAVLPGPEPFKEPSRFSACLTVADILKEIGESPISSDSIPPITLLRCGITGFSKTSDADSSGPTAKELFQCLEGQIPWLVTDEGLEYEKTLWETLSTCPLFTGTPPIEPHVEKDQKPTHWSYAALTPADPPPTLKSLAKLSESLPKAAKIRTNSRQRTLQSLSDFTGYISTQVYMPYRPPQSTTGSFGTGSSLGLAEDEFRREIRALKGLVLNRRSFLPSSPRPNLPSSSSS